MFLLKIVSSSWSAVYFSFRPVLNPLPPRYLHIFSTCAVVELPRPIIFKFLSCSGHFASAAHWKHDTQPYVFPLLQERCIRCSKRSRSLFPPPVERSSLQTRALPHSSRVRESPINLTLSNFIISNECEVKYLRFHLGSGKIYFTKKYRVQQEIDLCSSEFARSSLHYFACKVTMKDSFK